MNFCDVSQIRATIAHTMLRGRESPSTLGSITLHARQQHAATRLIALIERSGGAMLAEPVGLGKTYTSLAVARHFDTPLTVVAPSSLRAMWSESLEQCAMSARFVTHEALSRGAHIDRTDGFVIVDEAHRVRSPDTRRYAVLAEFCRSARVLLVTATPLQNRRADLVAQLALFLGRRAWEMSDDQLAAHVVRSESGPTRGLPALDGPHRIELVTLDDCIDQLIALPTPIPAEDESVAAALLTYSLIHQWSSSRAALLAALGRRRARGISLLAALESGTRPTRAELAAWTHSGDAIQLSHFQISLSRHTLTLTPISPSSRRPSIDFANAGVDALIRRLRTTPDPDDERAATLRAIRARHPGERIIAFCHYTETVNALRMKLAREPGIAALTARGAQLISGRVSREAVLRQFIPRAPGLEPIRVADAERIDLLLTTDLLSEGLNLQEASVIVHLDLPWNPARLDQRVGRVRRLGSHYETVTVYAIAPPAPAENLIRIEQRLRDKLSVAQHTVGIAGRILPSPIGVGRPESGLAEQRGAVERARRRWLGEHEHSIITASGDPPLISAVAAPFTGFLALVSTHHESTLVADSGGGISSAPGAILHALEIADGANVAPRAADALATITRLIAWLDAQRGVATVDLAAAAAARSRRTTLARVSRALERTPRHRRALLAPLADAARAVAMSPLAEGAERILETLAKAELPDEAWLRSIATFAALNARPAMHLSNNAHRIQAQIDCVILFQPSAL